MHKNLIPLALLLPLAVLAQTSPTLLDLQLLAIEARADAPARDPANIAAFAETRRAAEAGDVVAQLELARKLQLGVGAPQSTAQSMAWLRKSAEGGYAPAQGDMGLAYTVGGKVPIDRVQGEYWLRKGVAQGDVLAQTILALEFINGDSSAEEQALAITWLKAAANEQHFVPAMRRMVDLYVNGELGQQANAEDAAEWRAKLTESEKK